MAPNAEHTPLPWKRPAVLAVLLATMLCTSGLVVAIRQSRTFFELRLEALRADARAQADQLLREITDQAARSLALVAQASEGLKQTRIRSVDNWPVWFGVPYRWRDGVLEKINIGVEDRPTLEEYFGSTASINGVIRAVLNGQLHISSGESGPIAFGALVIPNDPSPRLLAMRAVTLEGENWNLLAVVDSHRVFQVMDQRLGFGVGPLKLSTGPTAEASWRELVGPPFSFMYIEPSKIYVDQLRMDMVTQVSVSGLATMAALLALVGVVGGLVQIAKREMALSRMKGDFVAAVSHELKTPLALIRMFAETLMEGRAANPQKAQEYYEIIVRESNRLTHLIDNILEFSRNDSGTRSMRKLPVDIGQVVQRTYDVYRIELDNEGFRHTLTIEHGLPLVEGDADALSQAVLNLLSNAVKYSEAEKSIEVVVSRETRRGRRGVLISVLDCGMGIKPEDRVHLFDGFFRGSDDRVRERRGTGLGLAVVKQVVDAHGGIVEAEARLVKGSAFRMFLPGMEVEVLGPPATQPIDSP